MTENTPNVDPAEVDKFDALGEDWWDPQGPLATLHAINPLRLGYINEHAPLEGARVLDVGCGAGILSESMARAGAEVTAIDLAEANIAVAREHASAASLDIDYRSIDIDEFVTEHTAHFDVVTCLELLEHVPSPEETVRACSLAAKPGGAVIFSTINRSPKSFFLAIVMAEYVLGMVPKGTHEYARLIQPAELARWCRQNGLEVTDVTGLHYNPALKDYWLGGNVDVNYLCHTRRREPA